MKQSITIVFPGQGSQYVGMGKKLEGTEAFDLFDQANQKLGYSLSQLCLEGPEEDLKLTQNAQPAIVTYSIALYQDVSKFLLENEIKIDRVLGHSVGEYSALVAAGVIGFSDAVLAVHLRGRYMQEAVPVGKGKMVAIMKVPEDMIKKACHESSNSDGQVMPANFNDPQQVVISGEAAACDRAVKWLQDNVEGRFRAIPLKVSAPFHSSLMQPAADRLEKHLESLVFSNLKVPYVANIDAQTYESQTQTDIIKSNLIKQVAGSVQWRQSIEQLPADTTVLEVGPGKVLCGLIKKIKPATIPAKN